MRILILSLLFIVSCSSFTNKGTRGISSVRLNQNVDISRFLESKIQDKIENLHSAYVLSYQSMEYFDQSIEDGFSLMENTHYQKLLLLRSYIEKEQSDLESLHENFFSKWKEDKLSNGKIENILKSFIPTKRLRLGLGKTSLAFLHEKNQSLLLELQKTKKLNDSSIYTELKNAYENFQNEEAQFDWKAQWRIELTDKNNDNFFKSIAVDYELTSPPIAPSDLKNGNVNGYSYPVGVWSLTFDDGPRGKTTPLVINNLLKYKFKATFFQLAKNVNTNLPVAHLVRDSGMEIGSHSFDHPDLMKQSYQVQKYQIQTATDMIAKAQERPITLFRLPYGSGVNNNQLREIISQAGLIHVYWSVDTLDWLNQDVEAIVARTVAQMKASKRKSGIILFHDIHDQSVLASERIMKYLIQIKAKVCPVEKVIDEMNTGNSCL